MPEAMKGYRMPPGLAGTPLERIVEDRIREIREAMRIRPVESLRVSLARPPGVRPFGASLPGRRPAVIAEVKKASPSAGVLRAGFDPVRLAREYELGGAAAISVLTEPKHFQGGLEILARLRLCTRLPLLAKDFIVHPWQVLEARIAGADAVLLIAALHPRPKLEELRLAAEELGMDSLVEVHSEAELEKALAAGAGIIGVNNRDLRSFKVDLGTSLRLAGRIPADVVAIAESGIRSGEDIRRLGDAGYKGFLVGELLVRSKEPRRELSRLLAQGEAGTEPES